MGVKRGEFYTNDGDCISVSFAGQNISAGSLTFAPSPVIIQMDGGGGEYAPVQYATASISIITNDATSLFDMCTQPPLSVDVAVYNKTRGTYLFVGYVTTNSFNQSIDSAHNAITIECVDLLGACKFLPYKAVSGGASLTTLTIAELLEHIRSMLYYTTEPTFFLSDFVSINDREVGSAGVEFDAETTQYHKLTVSEAYFYNSPTSPRLIEGSVTLDCDAITCYDVLTMIAESLRATFVCHGFNIILNDAVAQVQGNRSFIYTSSSAYISLGVRRTVDKESFAGGGNTLTSLPQYDAFSVTRQQSEQRVTPSVFKELLKPVGAVKRVVHDTADTNNYKSIFVQRLESPLVNLNITSGEAYSDSTSVASLWGYSEQTSRKDFGVNPTWTDEWTNYLRVAASPSTSGIVIFAVNPTHVLPVVESKAYSLVIKMSVGMSTQRDVLYPTELKVGDSDIVSIGIAISMGGKYYNATSDVWQSSSVYNTLNIKKSDNGWSDVVYVVKNAPLNCLTSETKNGKPMITLKFNNGYSVYYIKDFEIICTQSWKYKEAVDETQHKGNLLGKNAFPDVVQPITFGIPKTEHSFGTVIDGDNYAWGYFAEMNLGADQPEYATDAFGALDFYVGTGESREVYTFIDRIAKLANLGDRKEYSLCLKDARNAISPFDTFTSALWQGNKIVVAYQKDIEKNIINVTLN